AARAAGIPVVAVGFGYHDSPPHELGADAVIDHFDESRRAAIFNGNSNALRASALADGAGAGQMIVSLTISAKEPVMSEEYVPPKVWAWDKENGGAFASVNRPIAGPTHDKDLPVGKHPFQLYSSGTPNGQKAAIMSEESSASGFSEAEYDAWSIKIFESDQFSSGFVDINPNSKIPALVDHSGPEPFRVFESGAISIYLAEKTGKFMPSDSRKRFDVSQWSMWQMGGLGPMAGQNHHFSAYAPEKIPYAIDRYVNETNRSYGVLNKRSADREFVAGDYSIADMAAYPWVVPYERQG
ncbi:hypothetical protein OY671_008112, partial [Metschnikowia pulcherrima]